MPDSLKHLAKDKEGFFRVLPDGSMTGDLCLTLSDTHSPHLVGFLTLGDLSVEGSVYNENTDGAYSLIVLGTLRARNVLVGGQMLFVGNDATVEEFFGGDYNHGECEIAGSLHAPVIVTNDYRLRVHGQVEGAHVEDEAGALIRWIDGQWSYSYGDVPTQAVLCDAALEDDEGELRFFYYGAIEALTSGESLLPPGLDTSPQAVAATKAHLAPLLEGMAQYDNGEYEDALLSFHHARRLGHSSARLDFHEAAALYCKESPWLPNELERMRAGFTNAILGEYQTNESRLYLAYSFTENEPLKLGPVIDPFPSELNVSPLAPCRSP